MRLLMSWIFFIYVSPLGFLRDDRVLQQAYKKWIELKSTKDIRLVNTCPQGNVTCNHSDKMCLHEATNVVQWWNPFNLENSGDVTKYLEALEVIISFPGSSCRNIKNRGEEAREIASSRLKDLFFCKVNYDPNILIKPFNQAFDDVIKEKMASLGFYDMDRDLQEMFVENWASAQRPVLSETRKNFIRSHMGAINVTFPWQKCLCDEIFFPLPGFKEAFYTQGANLLVQNLLKFAGATHSDIKGQMDRILQLLHVYETLHHISPNIKFGCPNDSLEFMGGHVNAARSNLKDIISAALKNILEQIENDSSIDPSFGRPENINKDVDIYVLTNHVMRYVNKLSNNITLDSILINTGDESTTAFDYYMLKLVSCLKSNLKQKAGRFNGCKAAPHIFWMNNLNYIVQQIKKVGLGTLLEKEELEIQQYLNNYIDSTWREPLSRSIAKKSLDFNTAIEEIINAQASLKVPDCDLRSKLTETVSGKITEFLIENKLDPEKYLTGDLRSTLSNLFEG